MCYFEGMEKKRIVSDGVKSFIVGATMTVPGVSGGSMAMVLGLYDRLISAVPELLGRNFLRSFLFLLMCGGCGLVGAVAASPLLSWLLKNYYSLVMFFFIGVVTGSMPMIVGKCRLTKRTWPCIFFSLIGIAAVFALSYVPMAINAGGEGAVVQVLAGVVVSVGFVLPGISTTYLLVVLGLYDWILSCLSALDFLPLVPLALGVVLGVFLLTGILKKCMERFPSVTFPVILGFVLGSLPSVFPPIEPGWGLVGGIILCILGFCLTFFVLRED